MLAQAGSLLLLAALDGHGRLLLATVLFGSPSATC
jgi:hypothetical protein